MNRSNKQHHHKTNIDNGVHPFKATSPGPLQRENIFIKEKWENLIQYQMVIYYSKWILPGYSTLPHKPPSSFGFEFGAKMALLGPFEFFSDFPQPA